MLGWIAGGMLVSTPGQPDRWQWMFKLPQAARCLRRLRGRRPAGADHQQEPSPASAIRPLPSSKANRASSQAWERSHGQRSSYVDDADQKLESMAVRSAAANTTGAGGLRAAHDHRIQQMGEPQRENWRADEYDGCSAQLQYLAGRRRLNQVSTVLTGAAT